MSGYSTGQSSSQGTSTSSSNSVLVPQPAMAYENQWNTALTALQGQQMAWAQQQYGKSSQLTDQIVNDAVNFASPDRINQNMGAAEAGQQQAGQAARANLEQQLQSYGINPGDPAYAGALAAANTQSGAAAAAAGQNAQRATQATGTAMMNTAQQEELANVASGANTMGTAPGYANAAVANVKFAPLGTNSTSNSQNTAQSTQQSVQSNPPTTPNNSNQSGGGGGGGNQGGTGNYNMTGGDPGINGYNGGGGGGGGSGGGGGNFSVPNGIGNADIINASPSDTGGGSNDSGGGAIWDSGGGDLGSDGGNAAGDFAQGGAIPDGTTGGFVSKHLSPSKGTVTDDIPAKLNADEFVMPRDVTQWYGQKFFQDLITKSRKARGAAPGKPTPDKGGTQRAAAGGAMPTTGAVTAQGSPSSGYYGGYTSPQQAAPDPAAAGAIPSPLSVDPSSSAGTSYLDNPPTATASPLATAAIPEPSWNDFNNPTDYTSGPSGGAAASPWQTGGGITGGAGPGGAAASPWQTGGGIMGGDGPGFSL